jgi:hypothetical protein
MQKTYATLIIIFTAFLSSVFVYLMIGYFQQQLQQQGFAPALATPLFYGLLVASFGNVAAAQVIKQRSFGDRATECGTPEKLHAYVTTRHIVMYALSEVPAIFGLLYVLMTGDFLRLALFIGLSVVSFLLVKPSLSALEEFQRRNGAARSAP